MKDEKKALVPRLRFPEFLKSREWDGFFANALFEQISNKDHQGDLPILAITQEHGAIPRDLIDYHVSVNEKSVKGYKIVEVGDFIISLRSFQGGIEYSKYRGICSPAYVILRKRSSDVIDGFFRHYFKTSSFIRDLTKNLEGIRDGKMVSYKQFSEVLLPLPKREEQQKIADCLSSLDALIAAQTEKFDALKIHKKGLMQQLFPRAGETAPRLRFPEFRDAGEWTGKVLGEVCDMQAGKFVRASDIKEEIGDGLYPCYGGNGLRGYTVTFTHTGEYSLIGRQGALCGNVTLVADQFHATEHAVVVTPNEGVSTVWLYYVLNYLNLNRFATGQAQPGLSVDNLKNVELRFAPEEGEQQKIADCLSSLDVLIVAQAEKIDALKTHKKGLLQQLFPSPEAVGA